MIVVQIVSLIGLQLSIRLILLTENREAALKVISRVNHVLEADTPKLDSYHKGGISTELTKEISHQSWPEAYCAALYLAQSFGSSWTLLGCAKEELNLVGREFCISGIEWAELYMKRD